MKHVFRITRLVPIYLLSIVALMILTLDLKAETGYTMSANPTTQAIDLSSSSYSTVNCECSLQTEEGLKCWLIGQLVKEGLKGVTDWPKDKIKELRDLIVELCELILD